MSYDIYMEPVGTPHGWADDRNQAELTRFAKVVFDSAVSSVPFVANLPEFQAVYGVHPDDQFSLLKKVTPRQTEDPSVWDVEFLYSRRMNDQRQATTPIERPPRVRWSTHQFDKAMNYDINGDLICNSAGDPLVGDRMEDSRCVAHVIYNVTATPSTILQFRNKINTNPFVLDGVSIDFKCAKIQSIEISEWHQEQATYYREANIVIEIREPYQVINASIASSTSSTNIVGANTPTQANFQVQGWQRAELDQGYSYIASSKKTPFLDDAGQRMNHPGLLNGVGGKLAFLLTAVGSEYYRVFDIYQDVDFSPLNLPTST